MQDMKRRLNQTPNGQYLRPLSHSFHDQTLDVYREGLFRQPEEIACISFPASPISVCLPLLRTREWYSRPTQEQRQEMMDENLRIALNTSFGEVDTTYSSARRSGVVVAFETNNPLTFWIWFRSSAKPGELFHTPGHSMFTCRRARWRVAWMRWLISNARQSVRTKQKKLPALADCGDCPGRHCRATS